MSVVDYEVGRRPGRRTRERVAVDPITLRVLGGAFHAIAKEMAGVLFRMSYSSIIRESEDLGAGIFDAEGRELCESDSTPMHIGSLPWYIRGFIERLRRRASRRATSSSTTTRTSAPRTARTSRSRCRSSTRASCSASPPSPRTCSTSAARSPGINVDAFDVYAEAKIYNAAALVRGGRAERGRSTG